MNNVDPSITILMADDDGDDRELTEEAFRENGVTNPFVFVVDGLELLDYLRREGRFGGVASAPLPGLILLDLNMPHRNGFEALAEIRADERLRHIPTVIFSTSHNHRDVRRSHDLGANSFIPKPHSFGDLCELVAELARYWLQTVMLPQGCRRAV
jgi:CheY-like chemotaxis protein